VKGIKMNTLYDIFRILKEEDEVEQARQVFKSSKAVQTGTFFPHVLKGIQYQTRKPAEVDPLSLLSQKGLPINRKSCWWVKYPHRAIQEIEKMHSCTNAALRCSGKKLIWDEVVKNNFGTQFYIVIETEAYPHRMPRVFFQEAEIRIKESKHMFGDGRLCLLHPDDYHSTISILEMRNLACTWCLLAEVYEYTKQWPAAEAD
jgi:hypothetical protein